MTSSPAMKPAPQDEAEPPSTSPVKPHLVKPEGGEENSFIRRMLRSLRAMLRMKHDGSLKEAIEEILEETEEDVSEIPAEEKDMIRNMLAFGDKTVSEIMTPRSDIVAVPKEISLEELKQNILEQRHTRIPIFEDTLDHIQGFVHIKDLFPMLSGDMAYRLPLVMRQVLFVPPSMKILNLLVKMRQASTHMAIVIDEYGGTDGLVTMEDLFEEIVGEIQDEHDEEEQHPEYRWIDSMTLECEARVRVDKLEEVLGTKLKSGDEGDQDFDTLGGLIFFQLGRVPEKGEHIEHASGMQFDIVDADARRIHKVRIRKP